MKPVAGRCFAVLPAAGIGSRMGSDTPKQYLQVNGRSLLEHSLAALLACDTIASVVVTLHAQDIHAAQLELLKHPRVRTVTGGNERSDSVLAGLQALSAQAGDEDWVLVHDAARPCLQAADIARLITAVRAVSSGGILAEPVVDTVKLADSQGRVIKTLDRSVLWRAQTPQMFCLGQLRDALLYAAREKLDVTDEASAMELAGHPVQLVRGSSSNLKVTVQEDLALAGWYLSAAATLEES